MTCNILDNILLKIHELERKRKKPVYKYLYILFEENVFALSGSNPNKFSLKKKMKKFFPKCHETEGGPGGVDF